jgi:hypothetical protein
VEDETLFDWNFLTLTFHLRSLTHRAGRQNPIHTTGQNSRTQKGQGANGYTQDTYNRGKYRERKPTQTAPRAHSVRNSTPTVNPPQTSITNNPPATPTPSDKHKHLSYISIPYCEGISEPLALTPPRNQTL